MSCLFAIFFVFVFSIYGHGNSTRLANFEKHKLSIGIVDVEWRYEVDSDTLHFKVVGPTTGWLAFGFSYKEYNMQDLDIALGGVRNKREPYLYDLYSVTEKMPCLDSHQNFHLISATEMDGITTLEFYRKRKTGDSKDLQFEVGRPVYLMWAFHPTMDAINGTSFAYHGRNRAHTNITYDVLSMSTE